MDKENTPGKMRSPQAEAAFRKAQAFAKSEERYDPLNNPELRDYTIPTIESKKPQASAPRNVSKRTWQTFAERSHPEHGRE